MDLPPEKQFHFHDGTSIGSIDALQHKLTTISYQEFYRHVNPDKNDFANWIRYTFRDEHLAHELEQVTSIVETVEILNDYLHPRPITTPVSDLQARIEENLFQDTPPAHSPDAMTIEEVPTTSPAMERSKEQADFRIIEENIEDSHTAHPAPQAAVVSAAPASLTAQDHARMIVKDFMYGLVFGLIIGILLGRIVSF